jgi:hypothetical protein
VEEPEDLAEAASKSHVPKPVLVSGRLDDGVEAEVPEAIPGPIEDLRVGVRDPERF